MSMLFLALYGLGNGFVLPFLLNVVLNNIHEKDAGAASGVFSTFQQTASALGISVIGGIFYTVLDTGRYLANYLFALQSGLTVCIVFLIGVWLMLCLLPNAQRT
ncbi:hypothetical protein D3C73_1043650 [compost metagenome]